MCWVCGALAKTGLWLLSGAVLRSEMYHHFVLHQTVDSGLLLHHSGTHTPILLTTQLEHAKTQLIMWR